MIVTKFVGGCKKIQVTWVVNDWKFELVTWLQSLRRSGTELIKGNLCRTGNHQI